MELEDARTLLAKAAHYRQPDYEPSIFALGGRGYFENPTTDLLAFFLDPSQVHGQGDCFLRALLNCLPDVDELQTTLRAPPQREVSTQNGNRIDLLLLGDDWDLLLENKILHSQINPFSDYEEYADGLKDDKHRRRLCVVLSPSGESKAKNWIGVSYARLIAAIDDEMARQLQTQPLNKWRVLADEFVLHLKNIAVERRMDANTLDFVFTHLPQINALNKLRDKAIDELDKRILERLQAEVPGYTPYTRRHTWQNGPALRYACNDWEGWSDVVLYLNCRLEHMRPFVRVYLCDVDKALMDEGRKLFTQPTKAPWTEGKSIIGFEWGLGEFNEQRVIEMMVSKMRDLMRFENQIRASQEQAK